MMTLRDLQIQFVMDLFDKNPGHHRAYIIGGKLPSNERIEIYRNNIFSNYRAALKAIYPVVEKLVGEEFFRHTSDCYIRAHPSTSGDLNSYGAYFSDFLSSFEPAQPLGYLPDVARLEWLMELAFHAADHLPFNLSKLSTVATEQYGELRFTVNPAAQLIASDYPIAQIWQVNQPDWQGEMAVDLQQGGCKLLVNRENFNIAIKPLSDGEYLMLEGLAKGENISSVLCKVLEGQHDLVLGDFLQRMIFEGVLVDVQT